MILVAQFGYVAAASGIVMAVAALKGYVLLGGRLSKKGVAIASVLMVAATWLAHGLMWAISAAPVLGAGVFETWVSLPDLISLTGTGREYWSELVMLYLFTLAGAVPTVISTMRKARAAEQANAQPQPWEIQTGQREHESGENLKPDGQ